MDIPFSMLMEIQNFNTDTYSKDLVPVSCASLSIVHVIPVHN